MKLVKMLLLPKTHGAEGLDVLAVDLDVDSWTRLITGTVDQNIIQLSAGEKP